MSSVDLGKRDINQLASNVQLPQWLTDFINSVESSYLGLYQSFKQYWASNIKPAVQVVIDDLKNGQFNSQLESDIKNLLQQFASLLSLSVWYANYEFFCTIQLFLQLLWVHRQDVMNFIAQLFADVYVFALVVIMSIDSYLEKAWELIKEVIKEIFGNYLISQCLLESTRACKLSINSDMEIFTFDHFNLSGYN